MSNSIQILTNSKPLTNGRSTMIKFKKMTEKDQEKLRRWRMLPEVTKYLLSDPVITPEQQKEWYESVKDGKKYKCWIVNVDGNDIGFVNLADIDENSRRADPGMFICEKEYRGKGLAKPIMLNLMRHAFEELNFNKIYGPVIADNGAAVAAYLKSGFKIEGYFKEHVFKNGKFHDLVMVAIFNEDWQKIKKVVNYEKAVIEKY